MTYDTTDIIEQDWIFVGEKKRDIPLEDIVRNAVLKMPHWLTVPEKNGMFFGAQAFCAWADDIENGRYENEKNLWDNYGVYVANLATNAGNSGNEPYLIKMFAEIAPQHMDMCNQIQNLYVKMSNQTDGTWKSIEDLGGGFNVTLEVMQDKEKRSQIATKIREAAHCLDKVVKILQEK